MKKRLLFVGVFLALVAASTSAAELKIFNTAPGNQYVWSTMNGYNVSAISDDGTTIYANVGTKATAIVVETGAELFNSGANSYARGFGLWDGNGGQYTWVASVGFNVTGANPPKAYWHRVTGAPGGRLRNSSNVTDTVVPAAINSVSMDYDSGDGWMVGHGMAGSIGNGVAWKITTGNLNTVVAAWEQNLGSSVTNGGLNGVSNAGIAAGVSTTSGAVLANLNSNTPGSVTAIPKFAGGSAGSADAISAGAKLGDSPAGYAGGYFAPSGTTDTKHAFRYALGSATSEQLFPIGGDIPGIVQEARVLDISDNGIAVGFSFAAGGPGNIAAIWLPGATTAVSLESIMNETMPEGIARLSCAVSITAVPNSAGAYTIAGQAVREDGTTGAFVATVLPEPATLGLLALGGLLMSRRRR